jgi:hypothetical protein
VQKHFEGALGADDFMTRVEMALYAFGFTGDNSIGERALRQPWGPWMAARSRVPEGQLGARR